MLLVPTFADNHTQNHINCGFALGAGAGRNVAPGKRVELQSGRNCFPGLFECGRDGLGNRPSFCKMVYQVYSPCFAAVSSRSKSFRTASGSKTAVPHRQSRIPGL